jgi:hypothetical protein
MGQSRVVPTTVGAGGVASKLAADRRRTAIKTTGDLANTYAVLMQRADPLTFGHGQIPMGAHGFRQPIRNHPAGLGAPAIPGLSGDADTSAGLDGSHAGLDQLPIPGLDLELPFPTSTTHGDTLPTELVLRRALEPKEPPGGQSSLPF